MSKHEVRDKGLKPKLAQLHEITKTIIEVEKAIEDLKSFHEDLVNQRLAIKTEIRFLGGTVPESNGHAAGSILWRLREGNAESGIRP